MQLRKATFSGRHRTAMCLDAAINTDDVGIGSPEASTGVLLADIAAGARGSLGLLALEIWGRRWGEARRADPDEKGGGEGDGERKAKW